MGCSIRSWICIALEAILAASVPGCSGSDSRDSAAHAASFALGGKHAPAGSPSGPHMTLPAWINLPYVVAGQGGSTISVALENAGDAPFGSLAFSLSGDPSLSLIDVPAALDAGQHATFTISYAGSPVEAIASAVLTLSSAADSISIPVFAVAGDPGLDVADWVDVQGAGGVLIGSGITLSMPFAPYPHGSSPFSDPHVHVFLPESYRDLESHDLVVHFHGFNSTIDSVLSAHRNREHLYASGVNAVLVVPQGPVDAPSGDFGKLMDPGGLSALLTEVLVLLYRDGKISQPVLGDLVLTSHSGGYQAVAVNLAPESLAPHPVQVDLYDSLYGSESAYETYALGGGILRSNYTFGGGTFDNNRTLAAHLLNQGNPPSERATPRALRDAPVVIDFVQTNHTGSTRIDGIYGEALRWNMRRFRHGPRIELREAVAVGPQAAVRWLAPFDEEVTGFAVETSKDGSIWEVAATAGPKDEHASFPLSSGLRVRVRSVIDGRPDTLPSDVYRLDPSPDVLVVDGFDRILDGSFGGLHHEFAAVVGESAGAVATVSHQAILEDGFDLSPWPVVLWLLGDDAADDYGLSAGEQQILLDYVDAGGSLIVSGSEVAWDLSKTLDGQHFLQHCFGAQFLADDSGSHSVSGTGPLAGVASFAYAGPGAAYEEKSPDALSVTMTGEVLLEYDGGQPAAVGIASKGALVGFPLELIDTPAIRADVIGRLLSYVR